MHRCFVILGVEVWIGAVPHKNYPYMVRLVWFGLDVFWWDGSLVGAFSAKTTQHEAAAVHEALGDEPGALSLALVSTSPSLPETTRGRHTF
jgi:hypothetical protein